MTTESDRADLAKHILALNLGWIVSADSKVGPIFAIDTAMLGTIAALAPANGEWASSQIVATTLAGGLLLASLICLAASVFPRLSGPKGSAFFFGGIAEMDRDKYVKHLLDSPVNDLMEDLVRQCHRNAEIAQKKYSWIKWSMILLFLSVLPWLVTVTLLYAARQ
jgi:hypothetical protein